MRGSCALTQDGMSLLRNIFDLHARHGAIMALKAPIRKRAAVMSSLRSSPGHPVTSAYRNPWKVNRGSHSSPEGSPRSV